MFDANGVLQKSWPDRLRNVMLLAKLFAVSTAMQTAHCLYCITSFCLEIGSGFAQFDWWFCFAVKQSTYSGLRNTRCYWKTLFVIIFCSFQNLLYQEFSNFNGKSILTINSKPEASWSGWCWKYWWGREIWWWEASSGQGSPADQNQDQDQGPKYNQSEDIEWIYHILQKYCYL